MLSLPSRTKMYLCMNPVDMRKSFDGLFGIVREEFRQDPLSGHLFLFVNKRRDHLPTYRSEDILVRHGLHIPRSTLCDWMHRSAMLLPFAAFITTRILKQDVLWTDDTPVMFFDRNGKPVQTKKGESSLRRGRFWPYIARGDAPYTVFDFTIRRDRDGPMSMLTDWSGFLHADA